MKAYINFKHSIFIKNPGTDYSGEGLYVLVDENGKEISSHYCSSRGFAEGDLTSTFADQRELLKNKGITEVYSNGKRVYCEDPTQPKSIEELWTNSQIAENAKHDFLDYFAVGIDFNAYNSAINQLGMYVIEHAAELSTLSDGELYNKYFTMIDKYYKDYADPIY